MEPFRLEKEIWSSSDFDSMGWHDVQLNAIAYSRESNELMLDIDYILEWVKPSNGHEKYSFWISPATLVFERVAELKLSFSDGSRWIIDELRRERSGQSWSWLLECESGEVSFVSSGFIQYFRRPPTSVKEQFLSMDTRGGISFARRMDQ